MTPHEDSAPGAGRVWLISGCASGFGRALAEAALEWGDRVVATARRPEALGDLTGERVLLAALDVTRGEQVDAAVHAAIDRFGRIDVPVNNAGYGSVGAVEAIDIDDLRALMDTMFFGAVALTQAVLPQMRRQARGAIVQISSQGGQLAFAGVGAYCAAKFALEGLFEALACEVAPLGIRALIVEPGRVRTGFGGARMRRSREIGAYADTVGPAGLRRRHERHPARRPAQRPPRPSSRRSTPPSRRFDSRSAPTRSTPSAPSTNSSAPTSTAGKPCHATPRSINRAARRRSRPSRRCWWRDPRRPLDFATPPDLCWKPRRVRPRVNQERPDFRGTRTVPIY